MKRFLLSLVLFASLFQAKSQAVFNEIWYNPGSGFHEYIELYNSGMPDNLDCYSILSFYKTSSASGFIVINLPNVPIANGQFAVLSSAMPFVHQGVTYPGGGVRDISWSTLNASGSIKNYELQNNGSYTVKTIADLNDVLRDLGNQAAPANFITLLYKGSTLVNGLAVGVGQKLEIPAALKAMPALSIASGSACEGLTARFDNLADDQIEYMGAGIGANNGVHRTSDGKCGTFWKSASSSDDTPGAPNGSSSSVTGEIVVGGSVDCVVNSNGKRNATYFVVNSATTADAYPMVLQLYQDNGAVNGEFDAFDQFIEEQSLTTAPAAGTPNTVYTASLPDNNKGIIVVGKSTAGCFTTINAIGNSCSMLPVNFRSFTVARNKTNVALKWETASEQNNRGFYIQRNTKGVWENIAFVFSASEDGNSNSLLTYTYNDLNTNKGVSQYRIQQVDLDGKVKYSDIRSVRGEEQSSNTLVYPNPSLDGKVNVVFEDQGLKHVLVSDMSGRIIRKYQSVVNTLQVDNLETGVYTIQITDLSSAIITTEKVLIKKR